ncbi:MAG: hypothetical protein M1836_004320 [Candelina mexicana]|nr:MAG: hypothetical protein M1836_004320 [Candelina mexicana]
MSSPRLTFLYPHLFKPVQSIERAKAHCPAKASHHTPSQRRTFQTSKRQQQTLSQRYGNVPDLRLPPPSTGGKKVLLPGDATKSENRNSYKEAPKQATHDGPQKAPSQTDQTSTSEPRPNSSNPTLDTRFRNIDPSSQDIDPRSPQPTQPAPDECSKEGSLKPLETVLQMDPPSSATVERHKPPHLEAPPYVHHFDTYTLVRDLEKGGFTEDQSVTAMKAVRGLLALNLDVAQEGMVSKSDVENETYLFRAACSELRTEIQKNRKSESDKMRTERSQLQHEVDILNQKLTQELLTLKDDLKGMFDDRKMAVRMEQRSTESSLHLQDLERKRTKSASSSSKSGGGEESNNDGSKGGSSDPGETAEALANLNQGTSASYVSLG